MLSPHGFFSQLSLQILILGAQREILNSTDSIRLDHRVSCYMPASHTQIQPHGMPRFFRAQAERNILLRDLRRIRPKESMRLAVFCSSDLGELGEYVLEYLAVHGDTTKADPRHLHHFLTRAFADLFGQGAVLVILGG